MYNEIQKLIDGLTDQLLQAEMQAKTANEIDKGFYNGYYSACKKHRLELTLLLDVKTHSEPPPQLHKHDVSGWQEFPAQKPKVGELTVMKFDDVGFFVQHYWDGLEEKYGPFQKFTFIQLPACR